MLEPRACPTHDVVAHLVWEKADVFFWRLNPAEGPCRNREVFVLGLGIGQSGPRRRRCRNHQMARSGPDGIAPVLAHWKKEPMSAQARAKGIRWSVFAGNPFG